MTPIQQLKLFFRTRLKVVPGGPPVGTPGSNRAAGVLDTLDALADFAAATTGGITQAQLDAVATTLPLTATHTADYTLADGDAGKVVTFQASTDLTLTIPDTLTVPVGTVFNIRNRGTGKLLLASAANSGVLLEAELGLHVAPKTTVLVQRVDTLTFFVDGGRA